MSKLVGFLLSRSFMFLLMGVCLGFSINILFSTFVNSHCTLSQEQPSSFQQNPADNKQFKNNFTLRYKSKEELEKVNVSLRSRTKISRPRFASTELGIKEKLLSAVLTNRDSYETLGVAVNKTFQTTKSKLLFFMNFESSKISVHGLSFIIFTHSREYLLPILSLKHLAENYIDKYNWFFIFPDSTYVDSEALEGFVDEFAAGDVLVAGVPSQTDNRFCDFGAGMLISQAALRLLSTQIQRCLDLVQPHLSASQNVVLCFSHAFSSVDSVCFNANKKKIKYRSHKIENGGGLSSSDVISISAVDSDRHFYLIHRHLAEEKLKRGRRRLEDLSSQSLQILPSTPLGHKTSTWPLGSQPQTKAKDRFDLIKWQYFSNSTLYHERLADNYIPLKGFDRWDVQQVLNAVLKKLNKDSLYTITLERLVNGYRRFDAARGAEYILDLYLKRLNDQTQFFKRVHYFKALGDVEMVPNPYVTEASHVTLILILTPEQRNDVLIFIDLFSRNCVESGDNSELLIVLIYESTKQENDDIYSLIKSTIHFYEQKYRNQGKIRYTFLKNNISDHSLMFHVFDELSKRLHQNSLISLCTLGMELKKEYINHIRMSTIQAWQVYFPVAFWSFQANLVYDKPPYPSYILINQKSGHYGTQFYSHSSFYLSDYFYARNQMRNKGDNFSSLYEMFVMYQSVHVLRVVDSALRVSIGAFKCYKDDQECSKNKLEGLASQSQMAKLLFTDASSEILKNINNDKNRWYK